MSKLRFSLILLVVALLAAAASATPAREGYLRYPDLNGDRLVFAAEGDLWIAPAAGGTARRITTHVGDEILPKFSPDGRTIAFTGVYDGNDDVYVVPAEGGEPRRLTWNPSPDQVIGWTPDGARVIFRSNRDEPHGSFELFTVAAAVGQPEKLPLGWAARIGIDPDSGRWAFTRTQRETRTWKRYRGGTHTTIWVGDPARADFRQVTTFDGMNAFPMWHGGRIFYLCDEGGTANLWSMAPDGTDRKRLTDLGDWDARFPSMAPDGRIVFMLAGGVQLFDPTAGAARAVAIDVPSDRVLTRVRYPEPQRYLSWLDLSPDGKRLALTARGEIFSVPAEDGVTLAVTRGSGARESWASFGPDGKTLVYVTDAPGEEEIRSIDAWGRGEPKVVKPAGERGWYFPPRFSPDGKWIAYADQTHTLYLVPADGGEPRKVDHDEQSEIRQYAFSPDGRWLAYVKSAVKTEYDSIFVYGVSSGGIHRITGADTNDFAPVWDPDGRYLYFLSDRVTNPMLGARDFENVDIRPTKPYLALLRPDVENPFAEIAGLPPKDEDKSGDEAKPDAKKAGQGSKKGAEKGEPEKKKENKPVEIDFEGIGDRVVALPVDAGDYGGLDATSKAVFWLSRPIEGMADGPEGFFGEAPPNATLVAFDLESKKDKPFVEGVSAFMVAPEANKIAVMKRRGEIYVVGAGAPPGPALAESKVSLDGVVIELDPVEEWKEIFHDAWRQMRDFYWDAGMGGVDWSAIHDHYAALLPRVATREDLQDLIGEMIGELSTSHTYVFGGDRGVSVPRVSVGLLGADLVLEGDAFRVARIYHGDPADRERAPLLEPGVGVAEGDYVLAVNHVKPRTDRPFAAAMEDLADKKVLLTVNSRPTPDGARDVVVVPLGNDRGVRYADWVRRNREYVAKKTDGKIAYVHIPDMGSRGLIEFDTWFYPQLDKEGMVVDVRWNGGGFVSQLILERFRRKVISFDRARWGGRSTYPYRALNGPFVVLTNQWAGSDGDIFPAAVQLEKLAPVIGKRSWGGVVGIRADKRLVDNGLVTQPEFAWWDPRHGWGIENRGVIPDIEVENLPQDVARGVDAQLDRGIEEVLKLHAAHPPLEPEFGPVRPRGRGAYHGELGGGK